MRLKLLAAGLGLTLLGSACQPKAPAEAPTKAPAERKATEQEHYACQMSTLRGEPPRTGDCWKVPTDGPIYEDDVWGRWDCATMGNRICGPQRQPYTIAEASEHDSFNALRAQLKYVGQWNMTTEEENRYRAEFVQNSLSDPNRGRNGYLQAEDGFWVPESFYK